MVGALLDSHLVTVCSGSNSCNNAFRFSSLRLRTGAVGCGSSGVSSRFWLLPEWAHPECFSQYSEQSGLS